MPAAGTWSSPSRARRGRRSAQVTGSSSYFSWQDLRLYFGVGARTEAASAEIRWPSGQVQKVEKLALDAYHVVTEPR